MQKYYEKEIFEFIREFAKLSDNRKNYSKEYQDLYLKNQEKIKSLDKQLSVEVMNNNYNSSKDIAILLQGVIKLNLVNTSQAILRNDNLLHLIERHRLCFKSPHFGHGRNILHLIKPVTSQETCASIISFLKKIYPKNPATGEYPKKLRELLTQQDNEGFIALHKALRSANKDVAKEFISLLKDVYPKNLQTGKYPEELRNLLNHENNGGFTPLHDAFKSDNEGVAKEFISLLKEVYPKNLQTGKYPEELRDLLTQKNKGGFTPLHSALCSSNEAVAKNFISLLKDVYPKNLQTGKYPEGLRNLLTQQTNNGFTALHNTICSNNESIVTEFLSFLKEAYFKDKEELRKILTLKNKEGYTALHSAICSNDEVIAKDFISFLKEVYHNLKTGEYPKELKNLLTQKNNGGFTPLHDAFKSDNEGVAKEFISLLKEVYSKDLLELKNLLTQPNKKGYNALHHIVSAKNPVTLYEFVNFTKEQLGEVSAMSILFEMANKGDYCPNCVPNNYNALTDNEKNVNKGLAVLAGLDQDKEPDKYGRITGALKKRKEWNSWSSFFNNSSNYIDHYNFKLNPRKIEAKAKEFFENFNRVLQASISTASTFAVDQIDMPQLSISNRVNIDKVSNSSHTTTGLASSNDRAERNNNIVKTSSDAQGNIFKPAISTSSSSAASDSNNSQKFELEKQLHEIIKSGKHDDLSNFLNTVDDLALKGIINDNSDKSDFTPLIRVIFKKDVKMSELLIKYGADVNRVDDRGVTPLILAVINGLTEIAKLLIENGADVNKASNIGNTPLYLASQDGYKEIVDLLIKNGAKIKESFAIPPNSLPQNSSSSATSSGNKRTLDFDLARPNEHTRPTKASKLDQGRSQDLHSQMRM